MQLPLFDLDVPTLVQILVAGNLLAAALLCSYYFGSQYGRQWKNSRNAFLAKLLQGLGFLLISFRSVIPDVLSANLGNSLLLAGFWFEALAMLRLIGEDRRTIRLLKCVLVAALLGFNLLDIFASDSATRVISASLWSIAIFLFPSFRLLLSPNSSGFKQLMGAFYAVFLALLIPRTILAFLQPTGVLSNTPIQSLTHLALVLLMVFSLAAYLLLMKEEEDAALVTLASTDYLTGLPNRRRFFETAERLFARDQAEGASVGVLLVDIDHLKDANQRHGRIFGDRALELLAAAVRKNLRPFDIPCRYGDEEFVVLLPGADVEEAVKIAERIRAAIGDAKVDGADDFRLSVSVGVSAGPPRLDDILDVFISQAEQAMREAKIAGRNQVACHRG